MPRGKQLGDLTHDFSVHFPLHTSFPIHLFNYTTFINLWPKLSHRPDLNYQRSHLEFSLARNMDCMEHGALDWRYYNCISGEH